MADVKTTIGVVVLACALISGCDLLNRTKDSSNSSPTSPTSSTPTVSLDAFAGTWNSTTASTPAAGCGNVKYTVTPVSATSANVTFAGTCGGSIAVNGTGTGSISGSTLNWSATGVVGQGGVNCPFSFPNGKATQDSSASNVIVTYSGTVCGIPVSGTEVVAR